MNNAVAMALREQPATTLIAAGLCVFAAGVRARGLGYADVGLSYDAVVVHGQIWRCFSSQAAHIEPFHLLLNLMTLWSFGLVERVNGTRWFLQQTALLCIFSPVICLLLDHAAITLLHRDEYRRTTMVGYSCVLFGWMTLAAVVRPGGVGALPLVGAALLPMWTAPFVALAVTSALVPRASFVGHVAGILAGLALATGAAGWAPLWSGPAAAVGGAAAAAASWWREQGWPAPELTVPFLGAFRGGGGGGGADADAEAGRARLVGGVIVRPGS